MIKFYNVNGITEGKMDLEGFLMVILPKYKHRIVKVKEMSLV